MVVSWCACWMRLLYLSLIYPPPSASLALCLSLCLSLPFSLSHSYPSSPPPALSLCVCVKLPSINVQGFYDVFCANTNLQAAILDFLLLHVCNLLPSHNRIRT